MNTNDLKQPPTADDLAAALRDVLAETYRPGRETPPAEQAARVMLLRYDVARRDSARRSDVRGRQEEMPRFARDSGAGSLDVTA